MAITLGSNIASLRGQRQLNRTNEELVTVFQRLSSGQRINKASDDAAGLAIADSLKASSRIYDQGVRNLNDGLSLLSIADSAIENLSGIVLRLEELAVQSANGVYTNKQRKALDAEAQALSKEFFRISKATEFNGQRLLSGDVQSVNLQAGVGPNAVISAGVGGSIGTGAFNLTTTSFLGGTPRAVSTGDFDGDGFLDLASVDIANATLSVLVGTGSGSFTISNFYGVGASPLGVSSGDFNGDGVLDLVTVDEGPDTVSILLGHGNGTFAQAVSYSTGGSQPRSVAIGDFNSDGKLDLAATNTSDNSIGVLLGLGDGKFSAPSTSVTDVGPLSLATGDFNGDSILDLVTANVNTSTASVLLGIGNGTFATQVAYAAGANTLFVVTGDFNNDDALDFATSDSSATIGLHFGSGNGTFAARISYSVGGTASSVSVGDFNGDGFQDLVSTFGATDSVSVMINRGDGTFGALSSFVIGDNPSSVITNDFNSDGVLDLAVVESNGAAVSVLSGSAKHGVAPILPFSLKTLADARQAVPVFKRKREQLATQRGQIGAFQSRIDVARNVLQVSSENFKSAESRIRDADIAEESSRLIRLNILQQAASAILAQANQQPALALQLLRV